MKEKFYPDSSQPSTDCQDIKQEKTNKNNPQQNKMEIPKKPQEGDKLRPSTLRILKDSSILISEVRVIARKEKIMNRFKTVSKYIEEKLAAEIKPAPATEVEDLPEELTLAEEYEEYKLNWLIENGYTLLDFLQSLTDYAVCLGREKELLNSPEEFLDEWEQCSGFGCTGEIYAPYEEWFEEIPLPEEE